MQPKPSYITQWRSSWVRLWCRGFTVNLKRCLHDPTSMRAKRAAKLYPSPQHQSICRSSSSGPKELGSESSQLTESHRERMKLWTVDTFWQPTIDRLAFLTLVSVGIFHNLTFTPQLNFLEQLVLVHAFNFWLSLLDTDCISLCTVICIAASCSFGHDVRSLWDFLVSPPHHQYTGYSHPSCYHKP